MVLSFKEWVFNKTDKETAITLSHELDIDPFSAMLAVSRGITDPYELELLLSDELMLCDVYELADIKLAAYTINQAIQNNQKIAIYGDYDCDGVVATAVMYKCLKNLGASIVTYIPDRINEGYGMNTTAIDILKKQDVKLIITVDNGISSKKEIAYAKSLGIKTVVTDHHLPPQELPEAEAIVDPHRADCPSSFKEICGAEVAFKVVCAIEDKAPEQLLYDYADLLAVAILGDIMPLINENRCIVKEGIRKIKNRPLVGISAILSVAGIDRKTVNSSKLAFSVVPRINAAGRMGNANDALKLLCCDNMLDAIALANIIDNHNAHRQSTEKNVAEQAITAVEKKGYNHNRVIVIAGENWHQGTIGIVASRLCERFGKPCIVFSISGDVAHGSGRSISPFHLHNALSAVSSFTETYGGHELAAGVTVKTENIDAFRTAINEYASNLEKARPKLNIDLKINPEGLSVDMVEAMKLLEPFGTGNPKPILAIMGVTLKKITPVADNKHLRLLFSKNNVSFQAMLFGVVPQHFYYSVGDILDIAVNLESNFYKNDFILSVQIKNMRYSNIDQNKIFFDVEQYDNFISGTEYDAKLLLPSRDEVGEVYKYILKFSPTEEKLKTVFLNSLGFAKTGVAIIVLSELSLIDISGEILVSLNSQKTDLTNSKTYKRLLSEVNSSEHS